MDKNILETLLVTAEQIGYGLKVRLNNGHSMLLDFEKGPIEVVELNNMDFLKLKKSYLRLEEIETAFIYSTEEDA